LGKWSEPVKLPITINTEGNEGAPIFNDKRTLLYFTRCPMEKKKVYGCDIYMSKKVGAEFSEPVKLELKPAGSKDDTLTVGHPALASTDDMLLFSSNMKGSGHVGGKDLYYVKLNAEGMPAGAPVNLGPEINTAKDDMFPFLRFDGSLYFSSSGHPGMGGMDIYRAEKSGDGKWGLVENMKFPSTVLPMTSVLPSMARTTAVSSPAIAPAEKARMISGVSICRTWCSPYKASRTTR
jgi:peptidoglycan-associated lipoprotein